MSPESRADSGAAPGPDKVGELLERGLDACTEGPDHDAVRLVVFALVRAGEHDEPGVESALEELRAKYIAAVKCVRQGGGRPALKEFEEMVAGAKAARDLGAEAQREVALALQYVDRGVPAFPVALRWNPHKGSIDKRPLTGTGGFRLAGRTAGQLRKLFSDVRRVDTPVGSGLELGADEVLGIGLWLGPAGMFALDVDVKNGAHGDTELDALEERYGTLPETVRVNTASGGTHIWLAKPAGQKIGSTTLSPGIDVRADNGFAVAPGTETPWGAWTWDGPSFLDSPRPQVAQAPPWVLELLVARASASTLFDVEPVEVADLADADADALAHKLGVKDPRFRKTWARARDDLDDQSASGYDLAVAAACVRAGFPDETTVALLARWRALHDEDVQKVTRRPDYVARTLALAHDNRNAQTEKWVNEIAKGSERDGVYLVTASSIRAEHVEYLEDPLLPTRVPTVVTGLDGVGKSTILYDKAARATRGQLEGAFKGEPVDVVIASCEDHPASVIKPRLVAAGADLSHVHIVKVRRDGIDGDISLPDDIAAIDDKIAEVNAALLIIDPLIAHMPLQVDSYKAQHIRSVMAPLARLAEERRLAATAVVHFNGAPSTDVRTRMSGSKAIRDASRSVIVCGEDPDDESRCVMVQDKHSFGPKPEKGTAYRLEGIDVEIDGEVYRTSRVVWLGAVDIRANQLLERARDDERNDIDSAIEILSALVKETGEVEIVEVKKATEGISAKTLQRARSKLGLDYAQEGFGKDARRVWRLPDSSTVDKGGNPKAGGQGVHRDASVTAQGKELVQPPTVDTLERLSTVDGAKGLDDPDPQLLKRDLGEPEIDLEADDSDSGEGPDDPGAFTSDDHGQLTDAERDEVTENIRREAAEAGERFRRIDPRRQLEEPNEPGARAPFEVLVVVAPHDRRPCEACHAPAELRVIYPDDPTPHDRCLPHDPRKEN
jgi:hypothetical protein